MHLVNFIFLGTIGWGVSLYLIKILLVAMTPLEIVLYRMAIGAITLLIVMLCLRVKWKPMKPILLDGVMVALFNMAIPFYLTAFAEKSISSSLAAIVNGLTPIVTLLMSVVLMLPRFDLDLPHLASIILGLLGVWIIHFDPSSFSNMTGMIALLVSCFCYGIAANYVSAFAKSTEPLVIAFFASVISTILLFLFHLWMVPLSQWHVPQTSIEMMALLWLGVIGSGISLYFYCVLIQQVGASMASMVTYLMTVTGVVAGVFFLKEHLSGKIVMGCVFILSALLLLYTHRGRLEKTAR